MNAVYKYPLHNIGKNARQIPAGAKFLHVAIQGVIPMIWMLVDVETEAKTVRVFHVMPTGEHFDASERQYLGTFQTYENLVFHVFESI